MFRPRIGVDLSGVRIHTGPSAERRSRELSARAFTFGRDIVFAAGAYEPGSRSGLELIGHELVHVGQEGHVVRRDDPLPPAEPDFPVPVVGTSPRISVNLTSVVLSYPDTTNRFVKGSKLKQATFLMVRAVVADQLSDDWTIRAAQIAISKGTRAFGAISGDAQGTEPVPDYILSEAVPFLKWLQAQGKTLLIGSERMEVLELGIAGQWLVDAVAKGGDFAQDVLLGRKIPVWFTGWMQLDQMHHHGTKLRAFGAAKVKADRDPTNQLAQDQLAGTASDLFIDVLAPALILEAIRADEKVAGEFGYLLLWPPIPAPAPGTTVPIKVADPAREPTNKFGATFLAFLWTQAKLWPDLRSASGTAARKQVLETFMGWVGQARSSGPADIALVDKPATANMRALPATLTVSPAIGPPLFDASAESDYHFAMSLEFPDVFEAFASFNYAWSRKKVSDEDLKKGNKLDPFKGGQRPTWGEVGAKRFSKANEYNRADIKKFIDNIGYSVGTPGTELALAGAGAILRYVGTGFSFAAERIFTPRTEKAISFAGDALGPGLYVVACSATPVLRGQGFVRAPSVAWMPVFVRTPEEVAQIRLDIIVKSEEDADKRLADLRKQLDKPGPLADRDALVAEAEAIFKTNGNLSETLSLQVDELTKRKEQIKNDSAWQAVAERRAIDKQLDVLKDMLMTRSRRSKLQGTVERVPAVFVSDKGVVLTLAIEAVRTGVNVGDDGMKLSETWYVSDLTTPKSDDAERTAPTKAEAIEAAVVFILSDVHGYGRGTLSIAVGNRQKTIKIAATEKQILLEAVENLATALSVAAVAAAPFTAGASLTFLLPIGVIGAVPSAYRIASKVENGTFRWDMSLAADVVNIIGGIAGLGEVVSALRMMRLARGLMVMGVGANGLGVLVMGEQVVENIMSLSDLPPGLRAARTFEILGHAMLQAGIMIGAAMVERGRADALKQTLSHSEGAKAEVNKGRAFENWLQRLEEPTQKALKADPVALETFRAMDPEVRRALTLCGSLCIPIPPPAPADLLKIRGAMDRLGIADNHQGLREYLHDMRGRDGQKGLHTAAEALDTCKKFADVQRIFDLAIMQWAKDRGGSATKVGERWSLTRKDGVVVQEWEAGTFRGLAENRATDSFFQAHHGVQDAWGERVPGYRRDDCPAILLRNSYAGSPHRRVTDRQIQMRDSAKGRTYAEERALMIADLKGSEVPSSHADVLIKASDAYFGKLYRAWELEMRSKNTPQKTIDTNLTGIFGTWSPL